MNITKTIETKSRNSDWTLFAVDGEVKAWYAWIKATLSFLKLSAIPSSPLALRGDGTQSQNQSDVRPPGDRLLSKNAWMPWDLGGGGGEIHIFWGASSWGGGGEVAWNFTEAFLLALALNYSVTMENESGILIHPGSPSPWHSKA